MATNGKRIDTSSIPGKMRIKAFPPVVNDIYVSKIWETIRESIIEIQHKNNSGLSFEELYRNAYTMVLQKHGEYLYNGTKQVITEHLQKVKDSIVLNINNRFLVNLNQCWKDHQTTMVMIRDILMYMDRVYVKQADKESVYNVGLVIFREIILRHRPIQKQLQECLLSIVNAERRGESSSKVQIRDACQMLVHLGINSTSIYEEYFEQIFLEQSREFYIQESKTFLSQNPSAILYTYKIEQRIDEEAKRAKYYLDASTETKIVKVLEEELISVHMQELVDMPNSGLHFMLQNKAHNDIAAMFRVLSRVDNGPQIMSQCVSTFIRSEGKQIVSDESNSPIAYIAKLLELRDKANTLLVEALDNHVLFRNQIKADFEMFIKINPKSPEYLSMFIDEKLRRGTKGFNDPELDDVFDKCIVLFRYLQDKDVFERYYKQHLAKRLLTMKSQSDDQEKSMIAKLFIECGGVFTSKLEGMFRDMAVSKSLMEDWTNSVASKTKFDIDLYVRVLTTGLWPTQSLNTAIILPDEAKHIFLAYSAFYLGKHNGRVINLQPSLGSVDILANFFTNNSTFPSTNSNLPNTTEEASADTPGNNTSTPGNNTPTPMSPSRESSSSIISQMSSTLCETINNTLITSTDKITGVKKFILQVSTHQMIILMLFNKYEKLTYSEIKNETRIEDRDLQRSLISMLLSKSSQKILIKDPKTKTLELLPTDTFMVNDSFTSKHFKIKVSSISIKETEPERKETNIRVDENRKYVVEATIVRVMKARKTLTHNLLVTEVTQQLKSRFLPSPQMIKQRIESLLERDFLARSETDRNKYLYLA